MKSCYIQHIRQNKQTPDKIKDPNKAIGNFSFFSFFGSSEVEGGGTNFRVFLSQVVNGTGAVCGQKTSKILVSHCEESMAGHMGVNRVY
jgi:hypothetical protein